MCPPKNGSLLHDTANTASERTEVRAVGGRRSGVMNFIDVFVHFDAYFACSDLFSGSAETDVSCGGNLNCHLVASCVRNIFTKNY